MARFCGSCGNELGENDRVCGRCGTPAAAPNVAQGGQPQYQQAMPQGGQAQYQQVMPQGGQYQYQQGPQFQQGASKTKKPLSKNAKIGMIASAIVVVILAAVLFVIFGNGNGYKKAIDKTMKCVEDADGEALMDLMPDFLIDYIAEEQYGGKKNRMVDEVQDGVDDYLDDVRYDVGKIKSISYEIVDELTIDKDMLGLVKMGLAYSGEDIDISDLKEVRIVELEITVDGKEDKETYDEQTVICMKENGKWKTFPFFITGQKMSIDDIEDRMEDLEDMDFGDLDF